MKRVGERKSGGHGARAKPAHARTTSGEGGHVTQGGFGGKGAPSGSANLKGNKNKGRTRSSSGSGGAQSQGGKSKRTNSDLTREAARNLVFATHAHPRRSPLG